MKGAVWLLVAALAAGAGNAAAQGGKTLRWVVPFPPGGVADTTARIIAAKLGPVLGQTVVIENRPGAGGTIGAAAVARGPRDGSMLLIAGQTVPTAPSLYRNLPFSPFTDLAPVVQVGWTPNVLVVGADHPAKSVKDLVAMAKANPGKISYASVGAGSLQQLGAELFKRDAGLVLHHVPYKGAGDLVVAVMTGTVDFSFDNLTSALAQLRAGKLRALAFATKEREPAFPDVPTMGEAGLPGVLVHTWQGIWTTGGTPPERVAQLEGALRRVLAEADAVAAIAKAGLKVSNLGARELGRIVQEEHAQWDKILKAAGIHPQ